MPQNCSSVSIEEVVNYFDEEIDGMGKRDGHPRNEGVPDSIRLWRKAELCELTEEEFLHLTIPDHEKPLLKDKIKMDFDQDLDSFIQDKLKSFDLELNPHILIVRSMLEGENTESSFYIEDGAHTSIALGVYFSKNGYRPVKAYIGSR
jgi:hypothetical protein